MPSGGGGRNPSGLATFLGLDGGEDADRSQAQALARIAGLGPAFGQQADGELARSQDAAVSGKDRH
jgi:hypothetical protein